MPRWYSAILPDLVFAGLIVAGLALLQWSVNVTPPDWGLLGSIVRALTARPELTSLALLGLAGLLAAVRVMYMFERGSLGLLGMQVAVYALAAVVCWRWFICGAN